MELIALGGAHDPRGERPGIGGSAYALVAGDSALLVDFGVYPEPANVRKRKSEKVLAERPRIEIEMKSVGSSGRLKIPVLPKPKFSTPIEAGDFPSNFSDAQLPSVGPLKNIRHLYVVATHGHADHIGALPYLLRLFPTARVFMTQPTLDISRWSWNDHMKVMAREGKTSLFNSTDVAAMKGQITIIHSSDNISAGPFDLRFFPSGHILGAISVHVTVNSIRKRTVFFTGDISFSNQRTVLGAPLLDERILGNIDYLVSEATYADRDSYKDYSRKSVEERLVAEIEECCGRGGKFFAGTLSIGRTQEFFAILDHYGVTSKWPVYVDGPSAREISDIYIQMASVDSPIARIREHFITSRDERSNILTGDRPCVVMAPAGMYSGGLSVRYASAWASDDRNVIATTSYQDKCSPGSKLGSARGKKVKFGEREVMFRATVKHYPLPAHMQRHELLGQIQRLNPKYTFLVHGDEAGIDGVCDEMGSDSTLKTEIQNPYSL